jgi:hypothetical protein
MVEAPDAAPKVEEVPELADAVLDMEELSETADFFRFKSLVFYIVYEEQVI